MVGGDRSDSRVQLPAEYSDQLDRNVAGQYFRPADDQAGTGMGATGRLQ